MNPIKILVVDDTADWRQLMAALLKPMFAQNKTHLEIVEADSGNQAMAILSDNRDFNLIISDYTMPNGTGGDLFKYLGMHQIDVPFILFTALMDCNLKEFDRDSFVGAAPKHDVKVLQAMVKKAVQDQAASNQLVFSFT